MFGIVYVVFHVNMTFIQSEAWPLLSWTGEGGSWCSGAAGEMILGLTMGADLLFLEQPQPPLLARASLTRCRDVQPRG